MALMDREYVREAPSWHLGESRRAPTQVATRSHDNAGAQPSRGMALLALLGVVAILVGIVIALLFLSGLVAITYVPGA